MDKENNIEQVDAPHIAPKTVGDRLTACDVYECEICRKPFASTNGLGLHKRKMNARDIHSSGAAEINASQKRRRWTSEDMRVMATLEVEIISKNPKAFVNQELVKVIENRTDVIDGI